MRGTGGSGLSLSGAAGDGQVQKTATAASTTVSAPTV
ncbi:hypothetical protein SAMN04489764_3629 [Thermostaphylospora chromogena]|uniref:Uncharacterized protein n=1 Tax=Thermostaphylospora chromogena TaxID=35622 RepID=A0A1H1GK50_9ACTN|nr:hypothetical protein SAMN04489764_3629 [Thermostaphylospora chromogena]